MESYIKETILKKYPSCKLEVSGDGNHFEVVIEENSLKKLSLLEKHKSILNLFDEKLKTGEIHALKIKVL